MNKHFDRLLVAFETHSVTGVRAALDAGVSLQAPVNGRLVVDHLIEMYCRSDAFPDCVRLLLDRGAKIEDPLLRAVLLNDVDMLNAAAASDADLAGHRVSLTCAFTPLRGATLLHVAAEYGHLAIVRRLIALGADVNAAASVDDSGYNGHTPIFHTVNSNRNRSAPVMQALLEAGARTDIFLAGITWGKGFEWETLCLDVTPVSYAQLGLLPQMQRTEAHIYDNIRVLLEAAGKRLPQNMNVPNRYLKQ